MSFVTALVRQAFFDHCSEVAVTINELGATELLSFDSVVQRHLLPALRLVYQTDDVALAFAEFDESLSVLKLHCEQYFACSRSRSEFEFSRRCAQRRFLYLRKIMMANLRQELVGRVGSFDQSEQESLTEKRYRENVHYYILE